MNDKLNKKEKKRKEKKRKEKKRKKEKIKKERKVCKCKANATKCRTVISVGPS
jgi:hypothetical protein